MKIVGAVVKIMGMTGEIPLYSRGLWLDQAAYIASLHECVTMS